MNKEIKRVLPAIKKILSQEDSIVAAYLYGSQVTDKALKHSDIDIALLIEPKTKFTLNKLLDLMRKIEKETLLAPIDIRILNEMPLPLQGRVLIKGVLFYSSKEKLRIDYEVKTLKLYFDYLPYLQRMRKDFIKKTATEGIL